MSNKPQILVVDDERDVRSLFHDVLAPYDADVSFAANPAEAEEHLRSQEFALVISDMMMGPKGTEGMQVLAAVKATHPDTPVIIMTAYGSEEILDQSFHRGALSYLEKPILLDDVFRILDSLGIPRRVPR